VTGNLENFWELNMAMVFGKKISWALFRWREKLKTFQNSPSHQIFARMHGALNVGKK
jgi:hypothetical protein